MHRRAIAVALLCHVFSGALHAGDASIVDEGSALISVRAWHSSGCVGQRVYVGFLISNRGNSDLVLPVGQEKRAGMHLMISPQISGGVEALVPPQYHKIELGELRQTSEQPLQRIVIKGGETFLYSGYFVPWIKGVYEVQIFLANLTDYELRSTEVDDPGGVIVGRMKSRIDGVWTGSKAGKVKISVGESDSGLFSDTAAAIDSKESSLFAKMDLLAQLEEAGDSLACKALMLLERENRGIEPVHTLIMQSLVRIFNTGAGYLACSTFAEVGNGGEGISVASQLLAINVLKRISSGAPLVINGSIAHAFRTDEVDAAKIAIEKIRANLNQQPREIKDAVDPLW